MLIPKYCISKTALRYSLKLGDSSCLSCQYLGNSFCFNTWHTDWEKVAHLILLQWRSYDEKWLLSEFQRRKKQKVHFDSCYHYYTSNLRHKTYSKSLINKILLYKTAYIENSISKIIPNSHQQIWKSFWIETNISIYRPPVRFSETYVWDLGGN